MLQPSLPSWERGLKCHKAKKINFCLSSLPSWERGLKFFHFLGMHFISPSLPSWERGLKLPFLPDVPQLHLVAPLVGAWIEILYWSIISPIAWSLPSWERGLKSVDMSSKRIRSQSLPSWERGLKWSSWQGYGYWPRSLPSWERGLKYNRHRAFRCWNSSLPSWERGLKFYITHIHHASYRVAPLVGAWIEMCKGRRNFHAESRRSPRGSVD